MNSYYVYYWYYNDNNTIFYVGKGKGDRYKTLKERNHMFTKMTNMHNTSNEIFMSGLTEEESILIERALIEMLVLLRNPLLNVQMRGVLQREGIERAKLEGKYKGRKKIIPDRENFSLLYKQWKDGKIKTKNFMQALGVKKDTFYRRVKEFERSLKDHE
ncbi:MAG: hypothetical protein WC346_18590 [Methanogenium sp.]|jgi:hypothetical protein